MIALTRSLARRTFSSIDEIGEALRGVDNEVENDCATLYDAVLASLADAVDVRLSHEDRFDSVSEAGQVLSAWAHSGPGSTAAKLRSAGRLGGQARGASSGKGYGDAALDPEHVVRIARSLGWPDKKGVAAIVARRFERTPQRIRQILAKKKAESEGG
jgi:SOS response regulatory protein OraA/RecX